MVTCTPSNTSKTAYFYATGAVRVIILLLVVNSTQFPILHIRFY